MSVDSTLRKAAKLAKRGDRAGAARLYREVLAKFPGNATARKGLAALAAPGKPPASRGAAPGPQARAAAPRAPGPGPQQMQALQRLLERGDAASVIAEGQRLALLFPKDPGLLNLLGLAQMRGGKLEASVETFDRVTRLDPAFAGAHANKASALAQMGRNDEAEAAARAALKLNPNMAQAHLILGYALVNTGRAEKAIASFETAIRLAPNLPQAHIGLGNAHAARGKPRDALAAFEKAQALDPQNVDVLNNIGNALNALGRVDEAVDTLGRAARMRPNQAVLHVNYARALANINKTGEAIETIKRAIELDAKDPKAWGIYGENLRAIGEKSQAIEAFEQAIDLDPAHLLGLAPRWLIEPLPLDHPDYARMRAAVEDEGLEPGEKEMFYMTLFQAHDKAGDPENAFRFLAKAKEIRASLHPYDMDAHLRMFEAMKAQFAGGVEPLDAEALAEVPAPHRPVFIVGMPRSGTSLVEQITASHSAVHGAGELPAMASAMARLGWTGSEVGQPPDRDTLLALRRDYFSALERLETDRPVVTDKTPLNFRHLGHALAAMPEAKVLFMQRDARATCWSNFSHAFQGKANNFGNTLVDTARMYHAHLDLFGFWSELFPDRITPVPYERLTEHQEEETRMLLAAVDLEWEDACLEFHKTKRAVRTASATQVREKMYTGSSEAWRRYEPFLGPLLDTLGDVA